VTGNRKLWPKREAYNQIGVGTTKGDELVATGQLDARKIGKKVVITDERLDRYAESLPKADIRIPATLRRRIEQNQAA
jgi:hypothetical protein